ncbi:DUF7472 family protein [Haloarcula rubripromontorii]|uniref:Uncharacterized protein n=1 Tax=Haloarcula rubripromontorii TaxID=1705562 RepID=A0A0M9APN9_9EURY|nr:hypothetical protein [Haloarcula rubripromontorii]KOX95155.1 hypothetical protein AMS69_04700 [Haloarcula rubripromontorii]NLV04853.1 hypothetical protein [Haloarcula rubripromontorii]
MDIERETLLQIVISAVAVVLFVGATVTVSQMYLDGSTVEATGGYALIGAIGLFVVFMTAAGLWLERQQF